MLVKGAPVHRTVIFSVTALSKHPISLAIPSVYLSFLHGSCSYIECCPPLETPINCNGIIRGNCVLLRSIINQTQNNIIWVGINCYLHKVSFNPAHTLFLFHGDGQGSKSILQLLSFGRAICTISMVEKSFKSKNESDGSRLIRSVLWSKLLTLLLSDYTVNRCRINIMVASDTRRSINGYWYMSLSRLTHRSSW